MRRLFTGLLSLALSLVFMTMAMPAHAGTLADAQWTCAHLNDPTRSYTAADIAWAKSLVPDCGTPAPTPAPSTPSGGMRVTSASGLLTALMNAKGGETFQLADGNYGPFKLSGKVFATPVTIAGGPGAKFTQGGEIANAGGLIFGGVTFAGSPGMPNGAYVLKLTSASNITFKGTICKGADRSGTCVYPKGGTSTNISFIGGSTSGFMDGQTLFNIVGLTITGHDFFGQGADDLKISNCRNVLVTKSHFFGKLVLPAAHPDAFQIQGANDNVEFSYSLVEGNTQGVDNFGFQTASNTNFRVIGNRFVQGRYAYAIGLNGVAGIAVNDNAVVSGSSGRGLIKVSGTGISRGHNMVDSKPID